MKGKRKRHSAQFKAKIGLEALKGRKTIQEIAKDQGIHPTQVSQCAYSDEFGHPFRSISDSDSDSVRTLFGAERRCGWIVSGESGSSQGQLRGFWGL